MNLFNISKINKWKFPKLINLAITTTLFMERKFRDVYPRQGLEFLPFGYLRPKDVKVVILGQDPYDSFCYGEPVAQGRAFAVSNNQIAQGMRVPPSLRNIIKEAGVSDTKSFDFSLKNWEIQGVLLANFIPTVEKNKPGSHSHLWKNSYIDSVITQISTENENVVFMLWGKQAQQVEGLIDTTKHLVLKAPHPAYYGRGKTFRGCDHFRKANKYLAKYGKSEINWN